jgi:hypothetical protein
VDLESKYHSFNWGKLPLVRGHLLGPSFLYRLSSVLPRRETQKSKDNWRACNAFPNRREGSFLLVASVMDETQFRYRVTSIQALQGNLIITDVTTNHNDQERLPAT